DRRDLAAGAQPGRIALADAGPRIFPDLFHAESDTLLLDVDIEDDGLDRITLLEHLRRVTNFARPVQIGNVHQAVDAFLEADEDAEVGDVLHAAADMAADRMIEAQRFPGVGRCLLESERDAPIAGIDVENDDLD